jgi:hypothetical protein
VKRAGSILGLTLVALAISTGAGTGTALADAGRLRPMELRECNAFGVGGTAGYAICGSGYGSVRAVATCDDWAWLTFDVYGDWVGPGRYSAAICGRFDVLQVRYETKL